MSRVHSGKTLRTRKSAIPFLKSSNTANSANICSVDLVYWTFAMDIQGKYWIGIASQI